MKTDDNLYDAKGACFICSTSTVARQFAEDQQLAHAKQHVINGDPVVIRDGKALLDRDGHVCYA